MTQKLFISKVLPILAVLLVSSLIAAGFVLNRPQPVKEAQEIPRVPVQVMIAQATTEQVVITAMGTVIPARELQVTAEVNGRVVDVSSKLVPGRYMKQGQVIARIDPRDYQAILDQQRARLKEVEAAYELELGRQEIARQEWQLMNKDSDTPPLNSDLALRKPQLAKTQALIDSVKIAITQAQLNLERTVLRAPFNAIVKSKTVEVGQIVSPQMPLAILVGADKYWVQVSVPLQHLTWITTGDGANNGGSMALLTQKMSQETEIQRYGHVIEILSDLSPVGRLARLLVEVDDPLGLKREEKKQTIPLMIDAYVRVEINGPEVEQIFRLPRLVIREGNRIWIMDKDDRLDVRSINIAWRGENDVLIKTGIASGERIISSNLATPLPGMLLKDMGAASRQAPAINTKSESS